MFWWMRGMGCALKVAVLLLLLLCAHASPSKYDFQQCENTVKKWASSSLDSDVKINKHALRDLLFFLHIPRTGGRTFFYCFLKKLYSGSLECPRSYDKLRFNPRKPDCRLLSTHDDYSIMSKLPKKRTSVMTILRDPIDRVFSTYEFSVEVAARFLVHPNMSSVVRTIGNLRSKTKKQSTLDIWPWKYLVPWMQEDLFARRDGRRLKGITSTRGNNLYSMEDFVMPLHDYINNPIAWDIIHNGATFQIAGLTNNSCLAESHEVRHCVLKYQTLGEHVLKVAKKRLDDMVYIGLTENHKESAMIFSKVVGTQMVSLLKGPNSVTDHAAGDKSEQSLSSPDSMSDANYHQNNSTYQKGTKLLSTENVQGPSQSMTVGKLMEAYEKCTSNLRSSQTTRHASSLKHISPENFTKEARHQVPEVILQEITSFNSLDVELYDYAKDIFSKQQKYVGQKLIVSENVESISSSSYGFCSWNLQLLTMSIVLILFFIFLYLSVRRRTSKLKK